MKFLYIFVTIMFFLPFIGLLLYTALYPRESALFGKRWQFKNEDLEPSEESIKYIRNSAIIVLIIFVVILLIVLFRL